MKWEVGKEKQKNIYTTEAFSGRSIGLQVKDYLKTLHAHITWNTLPYLQLPQLQVV